MDDGLYKIEEITKILSNDFKSEKDLCDFIEINIEKFCDEIGVEYKTHSREFSIYERKRKHRGSKRIDFMILTKTDQVIFLECKHPKYECEHAAGIGQILSYIALLDYQGVRMDKFYLVSSKVDNLTPILIDHFNLPISFIAMDKNKSLTWQRQ